MAQNETRSHQASDRIYEDFEPSYEWAQDEGSDTLILILKGFRKENLRVQISATRILKLSGEQQKQISDNTWRRFRKEFTIPPHCDTNGIKAKLEGGFLYVRLPKVITDVKPATTPPPNREADDRENPREDKAAEAKPEGPAPPTHKTQQDEPKTSEVSQKKPQKEKGQAKEMGETGAGDNNVVQDTAKATTSEAQVVHETVEGLDKGENKIEKRSPNSSTLHGLIMEPGKQKKLVNFVVTFLVLLLGLYVKNAIKSYFRGSRIQEL